MMMTVLMKVMVVVVVMKSLAMIRLVMMTDTTSCQTPC